MSFSQCVDGVVVRGYQVASGAAPDSPYPDGSIAMQRPYFLERGLDLSGYYLGTLNVSIAPYTFEITQPLYTFPQVAWSPTHPPEDFSFARCCLAFGGNTADALVYYPHPETKPGHVQAPTTLEILAPYIDVIYYGSTVTVCLDPNEILLHGS